MSAYKIAWLPGDGVGKEVMEAARIMLDALKLDAEYTHGDIGWEFWCTEGDAFPQRTIDLLKAVDAAMFGAITSKPVKAAEAGARPGAAGQGSRLPLAHRPDAADVRPLHLPPALQGLPGQPAQLQGRRSTSSSSARTPRTSTPASSSRPSPTSSPTTLERSRKPFAPFAGLPGDQYAISCKINTRKGSERIVRAAFEFARKFGRKKVTIVHKANVVRATDGLFLEEAKKVATEYPGDRGRRRERRRDLHVAPEEPVELRRPRRPEPLRRHHLRPVRPRWSAASASAARATSATKLGGLRADATARRRSTPASTRSTRSPRSSRRR